MLRTAAWSVPAIAVATAAPAFATSACVEVPHSVDLSGFVATSATTGWVVSQPSVSATQTAASVRIDVVTVFHDGSAPQAPGQGQSNSHFRIWPLAQTTGTSSLRVPSTSAIKFSTSNSGSVSRTGQTITVTFSQPVRDLRFMLTDVDANGSNQLDNAWISRVNGGAPAGLFLAARGDRVGGQGTAAAPWRTTDASPTSSSNVGDASADGNVEVRMPGPVSSFELVFTNVAATPAVNSLNLTILGFESPSTAAASC